MKKKIYFDPPKNTPLTEYMTIKYGKIRDVHLVQLSDDVPDVIPKSKSLYGKDLYMPLTNFHIPLKLEIIDKYISKQKNIEYTHEVILPSDSVFNKLDLIKVPQTDFILKGIVGNRKMYIKLNFIDNMILSYYSFSWSNLNTNQRITIIGIIAVSIIGIFAIIFN